MPTLILSMPIYQLPEDEMWFPDVSEFEGDIIGVGGGLEAERLLLAYSNGIFPWYNEPGNIIWWCPEKRCVLYLDELRVSHSMRNVINRQMYKVTMDRAFGDVIEGCRSGVRQNATWLIDEMADAFHTLHDMGLAHSVEVWCEGELVGGLYGLSIGRMFYGESMFAKKSNSSKVGFITLVDHLRQKGFKMIDCQVYNEHLGSLGARDIPREDFLTYLKEALNNKTYKGKWVL